MGILHKLCAAGFNATASLISMAKSASVAPFSIAFFKSMPLDECRQLLKRPSEVNLNLLQEEQKGSLMGDIKPTVPKEPLILKILAVPEDSLSIRIRASKLPKIS